MELLRTDDFSEKYASRSVVTVGNFDGVHRGHKEIFGHLCRVAASSGATSVVVTFDPHPMQVLNPSRSPILISTTKQRRELIAESDIDLLVEIPFTKTFAEMPADLFVRDILLVSLGLSRLVIGHDYAFGRNREGNELFLRNISTLMNFELDVIEPVSDGDIIFSSSAVRRLVVAGDVAGATSILGRSHRISGSVVHGREIGRALGFPTANIETENRLLPADGVYAVWVETKAELLMGACSVGINPTFEGGERTIEVFILDYEGVLYGSEITIHFVERLRELLRFDDTCSLSEQIASDVAKIRKMLSCALPVRSLADE